MSDKKQYKVSLDLKNQILERVKTSGKTIKEIAEEHGLSTTCIYAWLRTGVTGVRPKDLIRLEKENRELKQIIGELTVQLGVGQKRGSR
ncbi:MAG: transposase [bacterium]|jgi:transposase-like protein